MLVTRWGPEGPQHVTSSCDFYLKAPRSGPRRAPGGSVQKKQVASRTTSDNPFRTSDILPTDGLCNGGMEKKPCAM
jgi:hypothetical protein